MPNLDFLKNDFERAEYLQNMLISFSTAGGAENDEYVYLRQYFLDLTLPESLLPSFIRTKRDLEQFWQYIKKEKGTYAERRTYLWDSFSALLTFLERKNISIINPESLAERLKKYGTVPIHQESQKATERIVSDPEGAITMSRTLIESVCKFILDATGRSYRESDDLSLLYKNVANTLNLSPDHHHEEIFKQILGGCSAVINGLGTLRNQFGDSHGKGTTQVKPSSRHAELAVNLSNSMSLFLLETYQKAEKK